MRRGFLGSIAALAAGAGAAWGQAPKPVAPAVEPPAAVGLAGDVIPATGPAPVVMPPVSVGPPGDPLGMGPMATLGPPPGPMYPPPGPYGAPLFQPSPGPGGGGAMGYGQAPRLWFDASYLLGFVTPQQITYPILTTGSPNQNGVLGQPTTIELIPGRSVNYNVISGYRFGGGFYSDHDCRIGFDINAFDNAENRVSQIVTTDTVGSVGIPVLARPFINATNGAQTSLVLISPTIALPPVDPNLDTGNTVVGTGSVKFATKTDLWGIEPSGVWNVFRSKPCRGLWTSFDFLFGYKFMQLDELIEIQSTSNLTGVNIIPIFAGGGGGPFGVPVQTGIQIIPVQTPIGIAGVTTITPATVQIADKFATSNRFNGGNIGLRNELRCGMFTLTTVGKVALGNMHQNLRIRGVTSFVNNTTNQSGYAFGGLYANSSNIGTFSHEEFAVIPEFNLRLGINLTRSVSLFVGYNVIYIDNVIRPGTELNPVIDPATIPFSPTYGNPTATPTRTLFTQKDLWFHSASFGFQWRY